MTDKADIAALRERLVGLNRTYALISSPSTMEQANTSAHMFVKSGGVSRIIAALDQLEAESKGADSCAEDCVTWMRRAKAAEVGLAALKGEQAPVAEIKSHPSTDEHPYMYWFGKQDRDFPVGTQFFTPPQKPVVLLPAAEDYPASWAAASVLADVKAAIEAAGGVVKDGE